MVSVKVKNENLFIKLSGELDLVVAKEFREVVDKMLVDRPIKNLVLDLSNITFIDSSGLGAILGRYKLIQQRGGKMSILGANPAVYRILDLSGILRIIPVFRPEDTNLKEGGIR